MLIQNVIRAQSQGRWRETARITLRSGEELELYFECDQDDIDTDFAHLLYFGSMAAFILREDLEVDFKVSDEDAHNANLIMKQYSSWYSELKPIKLPKQIKTQTTKKAQKSTRIASFYSGGVDALFTTLEKKDEITDLISIEYRDNNPKDIEAGFDRLSELSEYAHETKRRHIRVVTNAMTLIPQVQDRWADVTHGAILASIAHIFTNIIHRTIISSSYDYGNIFPWGSNPLTDPIYSNSNMTIEHFGSHYSRIEKTFRISRDHIGLKYLSVCGDGRLNGDFVNCSMCQKCLRTMTSLDLSGADKRRATSFNWNNYDPKSFGEKLFRKKAETIFASEIMDAARKAGRNDIVSSVSRGLRRSTLWRPLSWIEIMLRRRLPFILRHKKVLLRFRKTIYKTSGLQK